MHRACCWCCGILYLAKVNTAARSGLPYIRAHNVYSRQLRTAILRELEMESYRGGQGAKIFEPRISSESVV